MAQIAQYADGIGPDYHMLVAEGSAGAEADGDGERGACQPSAGASVHRARGSVAGVRDNVNQLYDVLYNPAGVDGLLPISRIKRCSSDAKQQSRMAATPYPAYELRFC